MFLSARRPGPARRPATEDLCLTTGHARLGYDRARILFTRYTGWELHQLRHSAATHLGDQGVPLQLIMAKTRHRSPPTSRLTIPRSFEPLAAVPIFLNPGMGSAVLLRDDDGRILLVEPVYKDYWELPGGAVDAGSRLSRVPVRGPGPPRVPAPGRGTPRSAWSSGPAR